MSSNAEIIVRLLNEVPLADKFGKVTLLSDLRDLLLASATADLLEDFLPNVLEFQKGTEEEVRLFIVEFVEAACKKHKKRKSLRSSSASRKLTIYLLVFRLAIEALLDSLKDKSASVAKKAIRCCTKLYPEQYQLMYATISITVRLFIF